MAVVFVATVFVHFLYSKQFTFVTFDAETAAAQGIDARRWESVFFVTAAVAISVATHLVGDLFVFGFLVIPPVTALLLGARVRQIFAISAILGAILPFLGLYLAFVIDVPASPAIVAGAAVVLALAWVVRLIRGKQM
jgi:manganese/iron transport system permease protein